MDDEEYLSPSALQVLEAHSAPVRFILPLSDNRFITAGDDGLICAWSTTGELLSSVHAHSAPITSAISLSENSQDTEAAIATAAQDGLICLLSSTCAILLQQRHGAKVLVLPFMTAHQCRFRH